VRRLCDDATETDAAPDTQSLAAMDWKTVFFTC